MNRFILGFLTCFLTFTMCSHAEDVTGFWNTISDKTGQVESIAGIYEYQGKYYGRLIVTFDKYGKVEDTLYSPKLRAPKLEGAPYYAGLDFIWNLEKSGEKYVGGKILDPEHGKIYDSEMWLEEGKLKVRGELLMFGRNVTWIRTKESEFPLHFQKPDMSKFTPSIPRVIKK